jgi:hypothetical protein
MRSKNARFSDVTALPTTVKYKTKSGETVSFKALKTVKEKKSAGLRKKRK